MAHVIGGPRELDGSELPLEEAVRRAIFSGVGVVVSCISRSRAIGSFWLARCRRVDRLVTGPWARGAPLPGTA